MARRPLLQGGQKYRHEFELPILSSSPVGKGGPHSAQHLRRPGGTRANAAVGGGGTTGAEVGWVVAGEVPDASVKAGTVCTSCPTVGVAMARVCVCEKQVRCEILGSSVPELVASCTTKSCVMALSEQRIAQHNAV